MPQWPWSVYSQKQRSVTTTKFGNLSFIALSAVAMMPSLLSASLPTLSFRLGMPNKMIDFMPKFTISSHSFKISSILI